MMIARGNVFVNFYMFIPSVYSQKMIWYNIEKSAQFVDPKDVEKFTGFEYSTCYLQCAKVKC